MSRPEPVVTLKATLRIEVAEHLATGVTRFLLDKRTGNVVLNVKDGQVLKVVLEEHLRA